MNQDTSPATAPAGCAYVSMLSGGDAYVPGLEVLGQSLQRTGTRHARVLMLTDDVSGTTQHRLREQGWLLRPVEPLANPRQTSQQLYPRFSKVFTKLRAWQLTEYRRVVFLDGDTIVLRNIDALFERPAPIAAAPDFFMPDHFNSGSMVLEPSEQTFADMLKALATLGTYDGGDQGFLNEFFQWYRLPVEHRLPAGFNLHHFVYQFMLAHPAVGRLTDEAHVIHYTLQKPWQSRVSLTGGSELWWSLYYEVHPDLDRPWKRRLHHLEDQIFNGCVGLLEN